MRDHPLRAPLIDALVSQGIQHEQRASHRLSDEKYSEVGTTKKPSKFHQTVSFFVSCFGPLKVVVCDWALFVAHPVIEWAISSDSANGRIARQVFMVQCSDVESATKGWHLDLLSPSRVTPLLKNLIWLAPNGRKSLLLDNAPRQSSGVRHP